jgi:hypothetical protein
MRTLIALTLALPGVALADNHFLAELEAGLARPLGIDAESEIGSAYGGTFGFGGRIPGHDPAYYLVGRVAHSSFSFEGAPRVGAPTVEHGELEVAVGGRVYLPLTPRLRVLFQVALGETFGETEVLRDGERELLAETEAFTLFGEIGAPVSPDRQLLAGRHGRRRLCARSGVVQRGQDRRRPGRRRPGTPAPRPHHHLPLLREKP